MRADRYCIHGEPVVLLTLRGEVSGGADSACSVRAVRLEMMEKKDTLERRGGTMSSQHCCFDRLFVQQLCRLMHDAYF